VEEEVRIREESLDTLNIHLSRLYDSIKHEDTQLETIQHERDFSLRQLEVSISENAMTMEENDMLTLGIRDLKTIIRLKDAACLETHMKTKLLAVELLEIRKKVATLEGDIKHADDVITEHRNKIQRARHLMSQATLDIMKQNQVVSNLRSTQLALNDSVTRRTAEIELLKVKIKTISGLLMTGDMAYRTQTCNLIEMKRVLEREVEQMRTLGTRVHHRRALQLEQIRLQKSLIQESGKCRGLEDELEKPLNIHRWRLLEGTNPELAQLVRMNMELRDRITLKLAALMRLRALKAKFAAHSIVLDGHLRRGYNGNIRDEFDFLYNVLRTKVKQLAVVEAQVFGQTDSVLGKKEQVKTIRAMVRHEKEEFFDAKKKVKAIRETLGGSPGKEQCPNGVGEHKLIGGGFLVDGIVRNMDAHAQLSSLSPVATKSGVKSSLGSPAIVQPRSSTQLQKKIPRGWNPQRGPLKSALATVSRPR
jgi:hypothetical protein